MQAALVFAPMLVITVASTTPDAPAKAPTEFTHSDQIAAYASAVVGVARAEKVCPGYRRNLANMVALRAWMAIRDGDKSELSRQTADAERKMTTQIQASGASSWCASIVGLFGPDGTLARGLLDAR
jgi:hypothetical protein